jgi:hypothetical protein
MCGYFGSASQSATSAKRDTTPEPLESSDPFGDDTPVGDYPAEGKRLARSALQEVLSSASDGVRKAISRRGLSAAAKEPVAS